MIRAIYAFLLGLLALELQLHVPLMPIPTPSGAGEKMQLYIFVLAIIYAALTVPGAWAFIVTGILGFICDLLGSNRLGVTSAIAMVLTTLLVTQQGSKLSRWWYIQMIYVLVGTFLYAVLEYIAYRIQLWPDRGFAWPTIVWTKIVLGSLFNAMITPLLFTVLDLPFLRAKPVGQPDEEEERPSYADRGFGA